MLELGLNSVSLQVLEAIAKTVLLYAIPTSGMPSQKREAHNLKKEISQSSSVHFGPEFRLGFMFDSRRVEDPDWRAT